MQPEILMIPLTVQFYDWSYLNKYFLEDDVL